MFLIVPILMMLLLALVVACCIGIVKIKNPFSAFSLPFAVFIALGSVIYLRVPQLTDFFLLLFIGVIIIPVCAKTFHRLLAQPQTEQPATPAPKNRLSSPITLCVIWLGLLIPLWQLPHVWDIQSGELSSSTPAVHDITGVSADTPLLQVEVTKEQPNIEFPPTYSEAYMPEDSKIGAYRPAHIDSRFTEDMAGLRLPFAPLMLTPDMVHPQSGWRQPTVKDNILTITAPDKTRYNFAYFTLPQHTTIYYSGSIRDDRLHIFSINTDPHSFHFAIAATKESLENMYRIYTNRYLSDFLFRLSLLLFTLTGAAALYSRRPKHGT